MVKMKENKFGLPVKKNVKTKHLKSDEMPKKYKAYKEVKKTGK